MKNFKSGRKSAQAIVDLASGELQVLDKPAPYVRPPWFRARLLTHFVGETKTQQSHRDQTDINNIVSRYQRSGYLPPARREPRYEDVTNLQGDLTELTAKSFNDIQTADADLSAFKAEKAAKEKADKAAKVAVKEAAPPSPPPVDKKE